MSREHDSTRDPDDPDIGLVGVGDVGQWFVAKLVRAGFEPAVYDADGDAVADAVEAGARAVDSAAELADSVDVVVLSLPSRDAVEAVMEGENGVLETLGASQVVVDTGTTPPDTDVRYQTRCHERDAGYVDCGITHRGPGEFDEETGPAFAMFVGGTREDYERARPVVQALAHDHEFYEGIGNGHVVKAANRLRETCQIAVAAEVSEFLVDSGIDPERVVDQLDWDIPAPYLDTPYPDPAGFERATETSDGTTESRDVPVDTDGPRTRLRTSDWASDQQHVLDVAHAGTTHVPMFTAAHQTMLAAENYGAALLDRELAFNDSEWRPFHVAAVYRAMNRPQAEWRRLSQTGDQREE